MRPEHRRYFAIEMSVAAAINAVLSVAFVFLVFGGRALVPVAGWGGVAADALPQSFMVTLMSCAVPTFLTRRRLAAGLVERMSVRRAWPRHWLARAVFVAAATAIVVTIVQALLLPAFGAVWSFATVLAFKAIFGALLGAVMAAVAIRWALGEQ